MRTLFYLTIIVVAGVAAWVGYGASASVARVEAQTAADAAALSGAMALMQSIGDSVLAAEAAQKVAAGNMINGSPARLAAEDIAFDVPEGIIRVEVSGRALPFDLPLVEPRITARAAAEARAYVDGPVSLPPKRLQLIE